MKSGSKQRDMQAAVNSQQMNRLEEIKKRRQEYLDSIRNYVEGEHEEKRDEFLYYSEQDIEYLLQRLERYEEALKEANTIIHDYKEARGYRERQVLEIDDIIKQALKE